jgi:hypothetical protein
LCEYLQTFNGPFLTDKNGKDMSKDNVIGLKKSETIIVDPSSGCGHGVKLHIYTWLAHRKNKNIIELSGFKDCQRNYKSV